VMRGGPADKAGIKPGDILLEVNGNVIMDSSDMLNLISSLKPGQSASVKIVRNQVEHKLSIPVGKRPRLQARVN
jgi:serine protease DegQ